MPNVPPVAPQFESDIDGLMYEVDSPSHTFKADEGITLRKWPQKYVAVPKLGLRMNIADFDWSKDQVSVPDGTNTYEIKYHMHMPPDPMTPPVFRVARVPPSPVPNVPIPTPSGAGGRVRPVGPVPHYRPRPDPEPYAPWMPQTPAYPDDIPYDIYVNASEYFNPYSPAYNPAAQYIVQHHHHIVDPYGPGGGYIPTGKKGPTAKCGSLYYTDPSVVERATGKTVPMQCSEFASGEVDVCIRDLSDPSPYSPFKPLSVAQAQLVCSSAHDYCSQCQP